VTSQPKFKDEIVEFSRESLKRLEVHLKHKEHSEDTLDLISDCLSVLSFTTEMGTVLRVFGAVDEATLLQLAGKFRSLVSVEDLISLVARLADTHPSRALSLTRLLLLEPTSEEHFEQAIRDLCACSVKLPCMLELLNWLRRSQGD
jgi:hypothetical protein